MIRSTKTIAIYHTHNGIELCPYKENPTDTDLICIVSHFPSALRIAKQVAQIRHQPLIQQGLHLSYHFNKPENIY